MGCKQSKSVSLIEGHKTRSTPPCSPISTNSFGNVSLSSELHNISDPGEQLHQLLTTTFDNYGVDRDCDDSQLWAKITKICDMDPSAAAYIEPESLETPLHLACRILEVMTTCGTMDRINASPVDAVKVLIRCSPESVSITDVDGYIPLHYIIPHSRRPITLTQPQNPLLHHTQNQVHVFNLLIAADYETSMKYLSESNVTFSPTDGACTPLYHAVSSIHDDFLQHPNPSPTVDFISAIHSACPRAVSVKNRDNWDTPLALLYRRFSRQFDLSEKFFPGDNSRKDVLEHRQRYKSSAMNTWKIIVKLLDPTDSGGDGSRRNVSDFYIVHSAVKLDCPPDLIRYIIETRPGEVAKTDEQGRLPLHIAAAAKPIHSPSSDTNDEGGNYHFKFMIDELLYAYPDGAACADRTGKLPLQLAIESGKYWIGGGVKSLYDVFPGAMSVVVVEEYPRIKKAMSFSSNFLEEQVMDADTATEATDRQDNRGITSRGGNDPQRAVKEEHYDAIMMVQNPNSDLGSIASAMWANEEDGGVQLLGCMAITTLTNRYSPTQTSPVSTDSYKPSPRLYAIALSAVTTIVNAMKNHPNEPAVQEKACVALLGLASADGYREVSFAASGAAASIVAAMQAHVSDAIVQREACTALRMIVEYGGAERATVIASVSGFTALQNALGAHPQSVGVQQEACLALEALTAFPDANLPDLPGAQTAPLLEAAAQRYEAECRDTAEIVLTRLS